MSIADEIEKLGDLHRRGVLSDEEFAAAKAAALGGGSNANTGGAAPPKTSWGPGPLSEDDGAAAGTAMDAKTRQWAMVLHLSLLAGFIIPLAGVIAPVVVWQVLRANHPALDEHGYIVVNWIISAFIYGAVAVALIFAGVGIPILFGLAILTVFYAIMGGVKANEGTTWPYPGSIKFLS